MGSVVVDASVILGVLDPGDSHHASATRALKKARATGDDIILPASALAEVLVGASRLGADAVRTTEAFVDTIVDQVQNIDRSVARSAAGYRSGHKALRLPETCVLTVVTPIKADAILTTDPECAKEDLRSRLCEP